MIHTVKQKVIALLFVALFALAASGVGVASSNVNLADTPPAVQIVCGGSSGGGC